MKIILRRKRILVTSWEHTKVGIHRGSIPQTRNVLFLHVGHYSVALG